MASNQDRTNFIGASDIPALFNLEPYWCRRRLWYEKSGRPADYPFYETAHIRRGVILEDVAVTEYTKASKREITVIEKAKGITHPKYSFLIVHPDRLHLADSTPLEIKCPTLRTFELVKREGLQEAYLLQLQTQIFVIAEAGKLKIDKGTLNMFCAEIAETFWVDEPRRDEIIDMILEAVIDFWDNVRKDPKGPEKLEPTDRRCSACQWRKTCQGEALLSLLPPAGENHLQLARDEGLSPIVQKYWQAQEIYQEAEDYYEEVKEEIRKQMGERVAVECKDGRIYYRPYEKKKIDYKGLLPQIDQALLQKYTGKEIQRPLKIYPEV